MWQVLVVEDGNDTDGIFSAITSAQKETEKPSIIVLRTHIAFGSPNKQDTADAHGAPLGEEEILLTKENLGCEPGETFCVTQDVLNEFRKSLTVGAEKESQWKKGFESYSSEYPELADEWVDAMSGFLKQGWDSDIPVFSSSDNPIATRAASGKVLNAIASKLRTLIGGSADLAPSNKTYLDCSHEFQKSSYDGRNIRFGVREHAMGAIMSGLFLHNGLRPFGGTFLVFADYMRPAIRVASLMKLPLIYVFTHDSVAVGEDGPTHQPVEHAASLRMIPNLTVIRPADAVETASAWRQAIQMTGGPVALLLSRQKLPILERTDSSESMLSNGAYILDDSSGEPAIILIASGSEVHIAVEAKKILDQKGLSTRVVSMPSCELFEKNIKRI